MKLLRITNEVFERALPSASPILQKMYTGTASFSTDTIMKAFEQTFNCRAYHTPETLRVSTDDYVPELTTWTLYFQDDAECTAFLLRWS
jgi:hypothetical protein